MKHLFICEKHNEVLLPWAWLRQTTNNLNLLTFDHHTDIIDAFCRYLYNNKGETLDALIKETDFTNDTTIKNAIAKLNNDEHINAAIKCGIISKAFVVSFAGSFDNPPSNEWSKIFSNVEDTVGYMTEKITIPKYQTYPEADIYTIGTDGNLDNLNGISNDFISFVLLKIKEMSKIEIINTNYILDIDLDYFHTYEALREENINEFQQLLSHSVSITIATEPSFTSEYLDPEKVLNMVTDIIKREIGDELKIVDLRK